MAMVGGNDILHDVHVIRTGYFMPFGLLLFIICQSFALARRFSRAFATSENLSRELAEKNIALEKMDQLKDEFLANTSDELLERTVGTLFDAASSDSLRALWAVPERGPANGAPSRVWRRLHLTGSDGARRPVQGIAPPLNLDADQLQVLIMRPAEDRGGAPNPQVAAVIDELNWHQSRLRGVEEILNGLLPRLMDQ